MPPARIDLMEGKNTRCKRALADGVYRALVEAVGAPEGDQFAIVSEHGPKSLIYSTDYLDVKRRLTRWFLQITLHGGRPVEVYKANWSYGNGGVQYVS